MLHSSGSSNDLVLNPQQPTTYTIGFNPLWTIEVTLQDMGEIGCHQTTVKHYKAREIYKI